tara:strand:- start:149 stop:541 length:393 start_codon:yes stop_codon:yes gene_type:complete
MAQSIERKHKLGKTIQASNFGRGYAWLFEGEGNPTTGTAAEIRQLNDINAPIGSKFTDLNSGLSYTKIDSTPDEERGSFKVGIWQSSGIISSVLGEPTGSEAVINMVSLTQAEYDAGTPVATTFYIITDA